MFQLNTKNPCPQVVCRELGFTGRDAEPTWAAMPFGAGVGEIVYDDVECTGEESHLGYCSHRAHDGPGYDWKSHNCDHHEDAGVICGGIGP